MAEVRERCEARRRDPSTMRFSMYVRDEEMRAGSPKSRRPRHAARVGLDRLACFPGRWDPASDGAGGVRGGLPGRGISPRRRGRRCPVKVEIWSDVVCRGATSASGASKRRSSVDAADGRDRVAQLPAQPDYPVGTPRAT